MTELVSTDHDPVPVFQFSTSLSEIPLERLMKAVDIRGL